MDESDRLRSIRFDWFTGIRFLPPVGAPLGNIADQVIGPKGPHAIREAPHRSSDQISILACFTVSIPVISEFNIIREIALSSIPERHRTYWEDWTRRWMIV
jgi:hypothetical protein